MKQIHSNISVATEVGIDNFIPNTLKAGDWAFILSSWRHRGRNYGRRMLVARWKTAERSLRTRWARYLHVTYTSRTRLMLVWHAGTRSHTVWNRLGNVDNMVSTRWAAGFGTLDTRLEHVGGWLTGAHVQFWTCWWVSHTVFTRSRHMSRCDCALRLNGHITLENVNKLIGEIKIGVRVGSW